MSFAFRSVIVFAAVCLVSRSSGAPTPVAFASPQVDARVEELLAKMTIEEKVGQLNQLSAGNVTGPEVSVSNSAELIRTGRVGSILNATTSHSTNVYQRTVLEGSRLKIPILFGLDVIHGFRTLFPIPLALSASWDPSLVEETAHYAAREASREGVRWTFSPMIDIARDPRWGRIAEGAGEDPYLGEIFARAYVRGYQGDDLSRPDSIVACAKHFVGYGAAEGGRDYNTTEISERTLRDVYLPPFHAAVDAGVGTLMSAFNSLDGVPASANHFTLTDILRGEWKFRGFVDSDWTAVQEIMVHGIANTNAEAARKSFLAGVDMDMQSNLFLPNLPALVRSGQVPMERLDEAVRGILRVKFALGLFDHPYVEERPVSRPADDPAGLDLARRAAEESFVLLENRAVNGTPLLPLARVPGRTIALIGPLADSAADMLGCWSGIAESRDAVTLKTSLAERLAHEGMKLTVVPGTAIAGGTDLTFNEAVSAASRSDLVILALGENGRSSGEASARSDIGLPGHQEQLLEAVMATGKPVVLVLFSGRPLAIRWAAQHVPAILEAWFPGLQAGPALVNTLFGDSAPAGRLTATMPRSVGQIPLYYDALNTGRPRHDPIGMDGRKEDPYYVTGYLDEVSSPQYPFGYGLTYTAFDYSEPSVDAKSISAAKINAGDATLKVTAEVRNTGSRAGVETVQLYIRQRGTSVARPQHELKGYRRVKLAPGESKRVEFSLGRDELAFWNIDMKHVAESGTLYIWVAPDSAHGSPVKVDITD
ncbi:MAG TPA: glycoside hydrolase family 3 N-terminal domain-containing protein [Candidatus Didemnitutus sp.]|nr:glycoside hydrolase family 3 N-terminal domain-containing protein [Candidatus Didemnitutus sp.]